MIGKRIVGVVTVKDGWAVQSFGYGRYLPLGRPEILIENLDRWGADEILLQCIDRSRAGLGPDMALLDRIGRRGLSTPMIYAGGVRSDQDAVDVVNAAADRVAVDALLRDNPEAIVRAGARLGNQAMIASVPLRGGGWLDYRTGRVDPLAPGLCDMLAAGILSEALLIDAVNEGSPAAFDQRLLDALPGRFPLIAFGGISEPAQFRDILANPRVVAVGVGNFLSYREHGVNALREAIPGLPVRPPAYQTPRYN